MGHPSGKVLHKNPPKSAWSCFLAAVFSAGSKPNSSIRFSVDFKLSCALKSNKSTVEEAVRFSSLISFQRREQMSRVSYVSKVSKWHYFHLFSKEVCLPSLGRNSWLDNRAWNPSLEFLVIEGSQKMSRVRRIMIIISDTWKLVQRCKKVSSNHYYLFCSLRDLVEGRFLFSSKNEVKDL